MLIGDAFSLSRRRSRASKLRWGRGAGGPGRGDRSTRRSDGERDSGDVEDDDEAREATSELLRSPNSTGSERKRDADEEDSDGGVYEGSDWSVNRDSAGRGAMCDAESCRG